MKKIHLFLAITLTALIVVLNACKERDVASGTTSTTDGERTAPQKAQPANFSSYSSKGQKVATASQGALLQQVSSKLQEGGPTLAVEYCHAEAGPLADSLSAHYDCQIARVSRKNRNPTNAASADEAELLAIWEKRFDQKVAVYDTVLSHQDRITYYRSIHTAMPACLKCHGEVGSDIATETAELLQEHYPEDKATGYALNQLRGAWKITFNQP